MGVCTLCISFTHHATKHWCFSVSNKGVLLQRCLSKKIMERTQKDMYVSTQEETKECKEVGHVNDLTIVILYT